MAVQYFPVEFSPGLSHNITVHSGDGDRFASLFIEAWNHTPPNIREEIIRHWTTGENPYVLLELSNSWKNAATRYAETTLAGQIVKFNAAEVDRMPNEVVKALIAHELAHVYQYAAGTNHRPYDDLESDAEDLISNWGFDWIAGIQWREKRDLELQGQS